MKIEESPYYFNGSSPVEKLRRTGSNPDFSLEDLDLSFLDLLTSIASEGLANRKPVEKTTEEAEAPDALQGNAALAEENKASRLRLVEEKPSAKHAEADFATQVDKDMALLRTELTADDVQYMKQAVIPGLPILMGSVPFNSIFPSSPGGEISYKGFDVSPKLAELIEKGYKTGRPIRVELDNNSAVVLKIRDGQVSAEFVSTDKGAALMLQQELNDLRNKLAAKNLPVGSLESKYQQSGQSHEGRGYPDEDDDV